MSKTLFYFIGKFFDFSYGRPRINPALMLDFMWDTVGRVGNWKLAVVKFAIQGAETVKMGEVGKIAEEQAEFQGADTVEIGEIGKIAVMKTEFQGAKTVKMGEIGNVAVI